MRGKKEESALDSKSALIQRERKQRTPEQIQACCNTCDMLAVGANVVFGVLVFPEALSGPVTATMCTFACFALVEKIKQDCHTSCRREPNTCWDSFETWKEQYKNYYPSCRSDSL